MLNAISWQQYLTVIFSLSAAWYAYVGLRYYRPEVAAWLKIRPPEKNVVPPVAGRLSAVMGAARPDPDTALYAPEELLFSGSETDEVSDQTLPKGPSDELLEEAIVLVDAYQDNDDKAEFLYLFKLLLEKYAVFQDEISLPAVIHSLSVFAAGRLPFELKETEWPLTF
jgi:hypothetical protein